MKKEQREVYLSLTKVSPGWQLCSFCKYGWGCGSFCSGEGEIECHHPLTDYYGFSGCDRELEPGEDCWGFRPNYPVEEIADIVGIMLSEGWQAAGWYRNKQGRLVITGTE